MLSGLSCSRIISRTRTEFGWSLHNQSLKEINESREKKKRISGMGKDTGFEERLEHHGRTKEKKIRTKDGSSLDIRERGDDCE